MLWISLRDKVTSIIKGHKRPGMMFLPLKLVQVLYSMGATLKNFLYDNNFLKPARPDCKVISVGNLTTGGSGKTPFACLLAKKLVDKKLAILSRGYGTNHSSGVHVVSDGSSIAEPPPVSADEPYMMAKKLTDVPVVCAPERIAGARLITEKFGADLIILDDGFQHRAIHRDIDILLFDARTKSDALQLVPLGVLREPLGEMKRADIIVVTGSSTLDHDERQKLLEHVRKYAKAKVPVLFADGSSAGCTNFKGDFVKAPEGKVFSFSGIANPEYFNNSLIKEGLDVAGSLNFPDHHQFTDQDIDRINKMAIQSGAGTIVTTEKDMVRLTAFDDAFNLPVCSVVWEMKIIEGQGELDSLLEKLF